MNITAKTIPLGVIGNPVAHSVSPEIHNFILDCMEMNYFYCAFPVTPENLPAALEGAKALGIRGLNVTVPHKEAVCRLCSRLDGYAERIGAVNTVVNEDGRLAGYNTDAPGFLLCIHREGVSAQGRRAVILGAGGAARSVAAALLEDGAAELRIVNRTRERAEKLAEQLKLFYPERKIGAAESADGAELLVNATSVGMKSAETPFTAFDTLAPSCAVCDIVYCPRETAFLGMARKNGFKAVGGIGMLIYQALLSFERFTGVKPDDEVAEKLLRRLEMKKSIVLTGFMGCGKSAVGRELAQMSGTELIDCDDYIAEKAGKSIPEIFAEIGEEGFRSLESESVRELAAVKGAVISLGGGAVLRRENIDLLRKSCTVVRLKADVKKILRNTAGDTNRPLLRGKTPAEIEELLRLREPYYENCDFTVDVSDMCPNRSAHKIMDIITEKGIDKQTGK